MSINSSRSCSCGGANPNCFRCDGTGLIPNKQEASPSKFFKRGLVKAGDLSPEELLKKQADERKKEQARVLREAQLTEERESIRRVAEGRRIAALSRIEGTPSPPAPHLSQPPSTPAYRCVKCSYKWNRDPKARCAWCNELGPYQLHQGKLGQ